MTELLHDRYDTVAKMGFLDRDIPKYLTDNINPRYNLRDYQVEALARFRHYFEKYPQKKKPVHLLFNMATGSGKTLLMALNILYLYSGGYRDFIFFVNNTNILEKTRENFLNPHSSKYLFNEKIKFGDKETTVREVANFDEAVEEDINIVFTTIQGLHSQLNIFRENRITLEDFAGRKVVLISDEAHHINAWTRSRLSKREEELRNTWEHTVMSILNSNEENVLLEYTATIDIENRAIFEKYKDKVIFRYDLKGFRNDGYSKDVKVLQADLENWDRMLQAVILSQYRRKVAERNGIYLKPVVLFRSKNISESKENYKLFRKNMEKVTGAELEKIKPTGSGTIVEKAFGFFKQENISPEKLALELKNDFAEDKLMILDSENIDKEKQLKLNSLEEENNEIRAIFAVKMLDEGWDVLNLFDIVRLYDTRDGKWTRDGKYTPGSTTIAEKQLIGRGARYYPFKLRQTDDPFKRKYDRDSGNELRVLEELYYHSKYNPKYIQELETVLKESGIMPSETKVVELRVKDKIKETELWEKGIIFRNSRERFARSRAENIEDIISGKVYKHALSSKFISEDSVFNKTKTGSKRKESTAKIFMLGDFGGTVIRKSMAKLEFYKFSNLKHYFPGLKSSVEFIKSVQDIKVEISSSESRIYNLTQEDKLNICLDVLSQMEKDIHGSYSEYTGTKVFKPYFIKDMVVDKKLQLCIDPSSDRERGKPMSDPAQTNIYLNIKEKDWYIYEENYGTAEEKQFIVFINSVIDNLKRKYAEIYLLRNESLFQLYRFSDGKPLEPDFVLFLKQENTGNIEHYQLFIEAKGDHLLQQDSWKEEFLQELESKYKIERTLFGENEDYKIFGLPFYNENNKISFSEEFAEKLNIKIPYDYLP